MALTAERDQLGREILDADADLALHVGKAKDILTTMANAVSAMKIFPSDHETVRGFVDGLSGKFEAFFKRYPKLEIGVGEYTFTCADRVVYSDEMTIKSLPFFFFKDGTESLYFYKGLERGELFDFLELIKTVSQKPGGDNDIVAALWESDFPNIQYYAPDEFLENQILAEKGEGRGEDNLPELPSDLDHESVEVRIDRTKLAEGRITLKPTDRAKLDPAAGIAEGEVERPEAGLPIPAELAPAPGPDESAGVLPAVASVDATLSENDVQELESLVSGNRTLRPEEEFINLTTEIIFLEEDVAICAASLDVLGEFQSDQIRAGQFPVASSVIAKVRDLRSHVEAGSPRKVALIDAALKKLTGPKTLEAVEAALGANVPVDWPELLGFFKMLGPATLPAAAGLFERQVDPEIRARILEFIRDVGGHDPGLIVSLANDNRPALSLEIIRLLSSLPDEKGVPHLSAFLMFKKRDIKLEAIHVLGGLSGEKANRILHGFLNDPDEDLRIQATLKLNPSEERSRIVQLIHEASSPEFRRKSLKEKQAFLSFLGRTRSAEALTFLSTVAAKATLLPSRRNLEMRLAAVAGLESMGTAESSAALEAGARGRGRKVREACAEALARSVSGGHPQG
jgi:HEAT repeat protein